MQPDVRRPAAGPKATPDDPRAQFGLQLERTLRYFQGELSGERWQAFGGDVWALISALECALRERQTQPAALDTLLSARDLFARRWPHAIDKELLALAVRTAWSPQPAGLPPERATAVLELAAEVYSRRGARPEAEACFRAALELADASGLVDLQARARGELGSFLLAHEGIADGLPLVRAGLALARACGNGRVEARALIALAWYYNRSRDGRRARRCLRRALPLVTALGEPNHIGRVWLDLGAAYQHLKDFDRAEKALRRARGYFRQSGDLRLQGQVWLMLGALYFGREQYRQAARHLRRAKQIYDRLADLRQLTSTCVSLGAAYWGLQDWPRAEAYSRQALDLARRLNLDLVEVEVLANLGWIYTDQSKLAEAAAALGAARAQFDACAERPELAGWRRWMGSQFAEVEARLAGAVIRQPSGASRQP